ncbi:MAG: sigma-70 family RNA polymerase sigma factor [Patescibacteria group bacterium]
MLEGEENIIRTAQEGDRPSFDALYEHYLSPIYRFIYMKVSHREEAEDLTHEVFASCWQNLPRYRSKGFPFSSWLYQIARNKVIDHYRVKRSTIPLEDVDAELVAADFGIERALENRFAIEKIRGALRTLTPDQQDVILMKFMEDLSHREIAAALSKSEGAIRLIQHRALNELRRLIQPER